MGRILQQAGRMARLETVLGPDVLVLMRFEGSDHLNALFDYGVDCLAVTPDIDFDSLLGTHATVTLKSFGGIERLFDGIVTEVRWLGPGENGWRYRLILRPWFWLATLRRNQRIFHNKSVLEILEELLEAYQSAGKLEAKLARDYAPLEYTVQYRESDFAFACRLMERFGISYHFEPGQGSHSMVLTDGAEALPAIGRRPFEPVDGHHREDIEHFWQWQPARRVVTGAIKLTDYNFKTPAAVMDVSRSAEATHAHGQIESFDYPGHYLDQGAGKRVTALGLDREAGQGDRYAAEGDVASLSGGAVVSLTGKVPGAGEDYVCLSAHHSYTSDNYGTGGERGDGYAYRGRYVLLSSDMPLAPELKTPRARVEGPQTAKVVGEDEIDCDEHGRILVQFPWDLEGAISMRCRVSQVWAGNGWGGMVIPRVGMEVVVEFLEGDPDKPLVTGCVYNGRNGVPYGLPANKTRATWKSKTHQGEGYNELRFEDANGEEEVYLHAQKDHNTVIEHDESHSIGNDRAKSVGHDQSESVGHDKAITVGNDHRETIGRDMIYSVGRNQQESYGKDHVETVGNILKQSIATDHIYEAGGHFTGQVNGRYKLDVGSSITTNTGKHVLMAFETFQIVGPGGKITIDASGVKIEAPKIDLVGFVSMGGAGAGQVQALSLAAKDALPLCEDCAKKAAKGEG